ncbi:MAG: preprotein translocase subunit YajC [Nitrospirota bacterium]
MLAPNIKDLFLLRRIKNQVKNCNVRILKVFLSSAFIIIGLTDMAHAMAAPPGGGGEAQGAGAMIQSFLPLILIFVIFYFLLIRPQSKKAKEHKQTLADLKKGDKVMTNGGIHGMIEDIDGDTLTLKIGVKDDVRIKINRNYIAGLR